MTWGQDVEFDSTNQRMEGAKLRFLILQEQKVEKDQKMRNDQEVLINNKKKIYAKKPFHPESCDIALNPGEKTTKMTIFM